ncbi:MAG: hypothetical protein WCK48_01450 [bacterium]
MGFEDNKQNEFESEGVESVTPESTESETQPKQEEQEIDTSYLESGSEHGIDFSVGWDEGYGSYTISFPDIQIGSKRADEMNISDSTLIISENPKDAKRIFEYTRNYAKMATNLDTYSLCKSIDSFIKTYVWPKK